MAYKGQFYGVKLGTGGLHADDPQNIIPANKLIQVDNCQVLGTKIEKEPGSRRWNQTALGSGIAAAIDYWTDPSTQRLILLAKDGKVYKFNSEYASSEVTPTGTAPVTLAFPGQSMIITAGQEASGNAKKVFIFNGVNPVQVISGDGVTRANIATPASDWSGSNQPFFGIIHRQALWCFGNANAPHRAYKSDGSNHESFSGGTSQSYDIYPSDGERLIYAFVFKGKLFFVKYPLGIYVLDDSDTDRANWQILKLNDGFGAASQHAGTQMLEDYVLADSSGSITSIVSVQAFGDIKAANILSKLRSENYIKEQTYRNTSDRHCIYYPDRQTALFVYRSSGNYVPDRIIGLDISSGEPRVVMSSKDQPNFLCLRKDTYGVLRPMYGSDDGYIYIMDDVNRLVGTEGYTATFQTPHMDFGGGGPEGDTVKNYEFLELTYEPSGQWQIQCDVYIDGIFNETVFFDMDYRSELESMVLDQDFLETDTPISQRKPIHGTGRRISFKFTQSGANQNFRLVSLGVYYKMAG